MVSNREENTGLLGPVTRAINMRITTTTEARGPRPEDTLEMRINIDEISLL